MDEQRNTPEASGKDADSVRSEPLLDANGKEREMGYQEALEAAGVKVEAFEQFGSYQGDWWARVRRGQHRFWITGSYGSCSGCDAFESELGWKESEQCDEHTYADESAASLCPKCAEVKVAYQKKLADFGREYLDDPLTQEQAEAKASENLAWDIDAARMLAWLKKHTIGV